MFGLHTNLGPTYHHFLQPPILRSRFISSSSNSNVIINPGLDYYKILGLSSTSAATDGTEISPSTVAEAYRKIAFETHPDVANIVSSSSTAAAADMSLLREARVILSNPTLRREYDNLRQEHNATHQWARETGRTGSQTKAGFASSPFFSDPFANAEQQHRRAGGSHRTPEHVKAIEVFLRPRNLFILFPLLVWGGKQAYNELFPSKVDETLVEAYLDPITKLYHLVEPERDYRHYVQVQRPNLAMVKKELVSAGPLVQEESKQSAKMRKQRAFAHGIGGTK
jgi:hypothetical protein